MWESTYLLKSVNIFIETNQLVCAANRSAGCYMIRATVEIKKLWEADIFRYFEQSREAFKLVIKQKNSGGYTLTKYFVLLFSYSFDLFDIVYFFSVIQSTSLQK